MKVPLERSPITSERSHFFFLTADVRGGEEIEAALELGDLSCGGDGDLLARPDGVGVLIGGLEVLASLVLHAAPDGESAALRSDDGNAIEERMKSLPGLRVGGGGSGGDG